MAVQLKLTRYSYEILLLVLKSSFDVQLLFKNSEDWIFGKIYMKFFFKKVWNINFVGSFFVCRKKGQLKKYFLGPKNIFYNFEGKP